VTVEPRQREVEANGLRFGVLEWGDEGAPLALLLHGYPDTAWTWRHLGPALAEAGWRAAAPFTRGYAPTDLAPDGSYLVRDLARDAVALRDALGGNERASLVGHDWGAVVCWQVTATAPDAFSRYVAMAVPPPPAVLEPWRSGSVAGLATGIRQLGMSWYFLFNQLPGAERTLRRLIPRLWRAWSPGYDPAEDLRRVFESLDSRQRLAAALGYYRQNLRSGLGEMVRSRPEAPALYLHGSDDGCVQAALGERWAGRLPPGSRFEALDGVGHFLQLEDPGRVDRLVCEWLGAP